MLWVLACVTPDAPSSPVEEGSAFDLHLAELDARIEARESWVEDSPRDWTRRQVIAGEYIQRARLSGDLRDYARAEEHLTQGFSHAPQGSGPLLSRAGLNYTLHRLERVEADLGLAEGALLIDDNKRASIALLRANTLWQSGHYDQGRELMERAHSLHPTPQSTLALALDAWRRADFPRAEGLLDAAEGDLVVQDPTTFAWLDLQRGLMDLERGRYDQALDHYRDADAHLDGYWLVEEHIAEVLVLQGHADQALPMYLAIVERTGNPEFMDALAELQPDADWPAKARAAYEEQLALYPESAAGHALGHMLEFGSPDEALELALANLQTRPNGEARELAAQAWLLQEEPAEALAVLQPVLHGPWRTASLFAVAAQVYEANALDPSPWREAALELNPHALD